MLMTRNRWNAALCFVALLASANARAQFAVIDVASITQLISQAQTLAQQLAAARAQVTEVQAQYQAMTGNRGMQSLLSGTVRNYLPTQWSQLDSLMHGNGGGYGPLAAGYQSSLQANSVLTAAQLSALTDNERAQLASARQSVALLQAMAADALSNVSGRFSSIQQLINAIPGATDQKAILDLQARIGAEQSMLQNEQTKLQVLNQIALGQAWGEKAHEREQIVAGHGQFATRFEPIPGR